MPRKQVIIQDFTTTTFTATVTTAILAAPGANKELEILQIQAWGNTNTTNFVNVTFKNGSSASASVDKLNILTQSTGTYYNYDFGNTFPLRLESNTSFEMAASGASSIPSVRLTIQYQTLQTFS